MAEEDKSPLARLVEAAVYAPLGIAALIREELPKLVERGQQEANMAKAMGQFTVTMGRAELEKRLKQMADRPARSASTPAPPSPTPPAPPAAPAAPAPPTAPADPAAPTAAATAEGHGTADTGHDALHLAPPGYPTLSAHHGVVR